MSKEIPYGYKKSKSVIRCPGAIFLSEQQSVYIPLKSRCTFRFGFTIFFELLSNLLSFFYFLGIGLNKTNDVMVVDCFACAVDVRKKIMLESCLEESI